MSGIAPLSHPLLDEVGVVHGFGVRGSGAPPNTLRVHQVHGDGVVTARALDDEIRDADAIVSRDPNIPVAIVTADCVPVLACGASGDVVVAIHAGWRGLAAGVVEAGIAALRGQMDRATGADHTTGVSHAAGASQASGVSRKGGVVAVLGPHIGACCYEVDAPVLEALERRYGVDSVKAAASATRPGHARISLANLVHRALSRAGVETNRRGDIQNSCTACGLERFYSHRREGKRAGRLIHYIAPVPGAPIRPGSDAISWG